MSALTILPNPAVSGTRRSVVGSGFSPNSAIRITSPTATGIFTSGPIYAAPDGTFSIGLPKLPTANGNYAVTAIVGGATVVRSTAVVAAPPGLTFSTSIPDGTVLVGTVQWTATVITGVATNFDFLLDGVLYWPEQSAPWGGALDTSTIPDGPHTLTVTGYPGPVSQTTHVTVKNGVVAVPPPATSSVIASGWASSKDNWRIGLPNHGNLALRFRKHGTGPISGVAWQQRIGSGYSLGDGGLYRASIQACKADGTPSGAILGVCSSKTFNVNRTADAYFETWTLDSPTGPILDGTLCCFVLENIHANPGANYISLNALFMWGDNVGSQRQAAFSDLDLALLSTHTQSGGWGVSNETPNFDVKPSHEGFGYTQCNVEMWKPIGGSAMVRELINNAPATSLSSLSVRVRRVSGSGALTILYETQAGVLMASGSVPSSAIAQSAPGGDNGGQVLATATLPSAVSAPAGAMQLRLTAPAGTVYAVAPIRKAVRDNVKTEPDWGSYMSDGHGEFTSDGVTWQSIYRSVEDQESLQFAVLS